MKCAYRTKSQKGEIVALVLTIVSAGILLAGISSGNYIVQKTTPNLHIASAANTWNQCQLPPNRKLPCGSCSIQSVGNGTMTFGCELDCGGNAANCPGNTAGNYNIVHRWEWCAKAGDDWCNESKSDYKKSDNLGGGGPWQINGQSAVNGSGTFPDPGCGRVQVDIQMDASGTNVSGKVYNSGKDCDGTQAAPTPCTPTNLCREVNIPCCAGTSYTDTSCPVTDTRCGTAPSGPTNTPTPAQNCPRSCVLDGSCQGACAVCPGCTSSPTPTPFQRDCTTYTCAVQNYPCTDECKHCSQCKAPPPTSTPSPTVTPTPTLITRNCNYLSNIKCWGKKTGDNCGGSNYCYLKPAANNECTCGIPTAPTATPTSTPAPAYNPPKISNDRTLKFGSCNPLLFPSDPNSCW